jgi:hypothetical protein
MHFSRTLKSAAFSCLGLGLLVGGTACSGSSDSGRATVPDSKEKGVELGHCEAASVDACGDFTTPTGTKIELGPYGAMMVPNVGEGFENAVAAGDADDGTRCQMFTASFKEDPALTAQLLDTRDLDFSRYTIYRPANWVDGEKYPVITWGNGTCAQPEGYGALLRYVASYGFVIIASNSRWVGGATEMLHGLDFLEAANEDSESPYYHRLDLEKIGAMGHSQGSAGTVNAAADPRVKEVILFNAGATAPKPFMAISGEMDITNYTPASMAMAVEAAPEAAYLFYHQVVGLGPLKGHLTLMLQPERVTEATGAWWRMRFNDDADARKVFVGASCTLCGRTAEFDFGEHGLD